MAQEQLKHSVIPSALADVVADVADLFQKELRLAQTEFSAKLSAKFRAGLWITVAAAFAVVAGLLIVQALVFGIAAFGIALHWSCLIVAATAAGAAALAYAKGRADLREELTASRAIHQVKQDIATIKEHLT